MIKWITEQGTYSYTARIQCDPAHFLHPLPHTPFASEGELFVLKAKKLSLFESTFSLRVLRVYRLWQALSPVIGPLQPTVYPKKYAHGFCFGVLCCGYTLTHFPISIRLTSLALWQSNYCPSASKATLMNMDKYFMWIHYERLRNHNKAKHNKTVCMFLGIYCMCIYREILSTARWM